MKTPLFSITIQCSRQSTLKNHHTLATDRRLERESDWTDLVGVSRRFHSSPKNCTAGSPGKPRLHQFPGHLLSAAGIRYRSLYFRRVITRIKTERRHSRLTRPCCRRSHACKERFGADAAVRQQSRFSRVTSVGVLERNGS
jgi:hypothetical protein